MFDIAHFYPAVLEFLYRDFFNTNSFEHVLMNTIFAMVAGFGFSYAFNPPRNIFIGIVCVSGFGYFVRSMLMQFSIFSLAGASFCASFCMGLMTMLVAKRKKVPAEIIVFPALLPMFPGSYGYKSILSILAFTQHADKPEQLGYLLAFFNNITIMLSVSTSLVAGVLVTFIIFYEQSFMMTRGHKRSFFSKKS
ncbi:threonine/serine exporter [Helicobacter didelphidarum]|uniref:Threonine/serine exporter n=1 Tax=Helicobacter didelphidarum TaxID=2040648 RepID=A0A3D8IRK4_9HELI|nr:threonine/serine exporter family protein [Helicobacter didelphidarum]RDU67610.1 threonine/serine exporter [Helicobacter didelphidarum]